MNSFADTFIIVIRFTVVWIILVSWSGTAVLADISRPDPDGTPTTVLIRIAILDIDSINTAEQRFTANVYFEARWKDSTQVHNGNSQISRPLHEVWHPRLQIVNRQRITLTFPEIVEITPQGEVLYRQRVWGNFSQPLTLQDFPFDSQSFEIQLCATEYTPDEVELKIDLDRESGVAPEFSLADWQITEWNVNNVPYNPLPGAKSTASVIFILSARRNYKYYIIKVIIPLVLIVAMSWVVFWIDPKESGTQISVSVTTMLTLIAYRFMVGSSLPKVSYLTRLDILLLGSTILVFTALIEVLIASTLAKNNRLATARLIDLVSRFAFPAVFVIVFILALYC